MMSLFCLWIQKGCVAFCFVFLFNFILSLLKGKQDSFVTKFYASIDINIVQGYIRKYRTDFEVFPEEAALIVSVIGYI